MSFLNLGLGELLGLVGAISAGIVALYLLDRSKRRQLVATLRFWTMADVRTELKHRRRIQQPGHHQVGVVRILEPRSLERALGREPGVDQDGGPGRFDLQPRVSECRHPHGNARRFDISGYRKPGGGRSG